MLQLSQECTLHHVKHTDLSTLKHILITLSFIWTPKCYNLQQNIITKSIQYWMFEAHTFVRKLTIYHAFAPAIQLSHSMESQWFCECSKNANVDYLLQTSHFNKNFVVHSGKIVCFSMKIQLNFFLYLSSIEFERIITFFPRIFSRSIIFNAQTLQTLHNSNVYRVLNVINFMVVSFYVKL